VAEVWPAAQPVMLRRNVQHRVGQHVVEGSPLFELEQVEGFERLSELQKRSGGSPRRGSCLPYHRGLKDQIGQEERYCLADGYRLPGARAIGSPAQTGDLTSTWTGMAPRRLRSRDLRTRSRGWSDGHRVPVTLLRYGVTGP